MNDKTNKQRIDTDLVNEYLSEKTGGAIAIAKDNLGKMMCADDPMIIEDTETGRVRASTIDRIRGAADAAMRHGRGTGFGFKRDGLFQIDETLGAFIARRMAANATAVGFEDMDMDAARRSIETTEAKIVSDALDDHHVLVAYAGRDKPSLFFCNKEQKFYVSVVGNYNGSRSEATGHRADRETMHCPACSPVGFRPMSTKAFVANPGDWMYDVLTMPRREEPAIRLETTADRAIAAVRGFLSGGMAGFGTLKIDRAGTVSFA